MLPHLLWHVLARVGGAVVLRLEALCCLQRGATALPAEICILLPGNTGDSNKVKVITVLGYSINGLILIALLQAPDVSGLSRED